MSDIKLTPVQARLLENIATAKEINLKRGYVQYFKKHEDEKGRRWTHVTAFMNRTYDVLENEYGLIETHPYYEPSFSTLERWCMLTDKGVDYARGRGWTLWGER